MTVDYALSPSFADSDLATVTVTERGRRALGMSGPDCAYGQLQYLDADLEDVVLDRLEGTLAYDFGTLSVAIRGRAEAVPGRGASRRCA